MVDLFVVYFDTVFYFMLSWSVAVFFSGSHFPACGTACDTAAQQCQSSQFQSDSEPDVCSRSSVDGLFPVLSTISQCADVIFNRGTNAPFPVTAHLHNIGAADDGAAADIGATV